MRRWRAPARLWAATLALALLAAGGPAPALRATLPLAVAPAAAADSTAATESAPPETGERAIPDFVGYVNDQAAVLDEGTHAQLEAFLDQLEKKTGVQFALLTVKSTAPETPSEYKVRVFQKWGIGKRGRDDGLLMLVALEERQVRFETGYGLEGTLPDGLQSRIFRETMAPRFRAGDYPGGITAGVLACAAPIAREHGVTLEWNGEELRYDARRGGAGGVPGWVVALVFFFIVSSIVSRLGGRRRGLGGWWWLGPGGFGGWGGGFGGGFGGGGGGSSFGGFGGGSSGGGGGGGSW
jgi:uncharacterized protein